MYDRLLRFTKMEGCGNDYIYIDGTEGAGEGLDKKKLAVELSNRHFGIGSDGVIWINSSDMRQRDPVCRRFRQGTRPACRQYRQDRKLRESQRTVLSFGSR